MPRIILAAQCVRHLALHPSMVWAFAKAYARKFALMARNAGLTVAVGALAFLAAPDDIRREWFKEGRI